MAIRIILVTYISVYCLSLIGVENAYGANPIDRKWMFIISYYFELTGI